MCRRTVKIFVLTAALCILTQSLIAAPGWGLRRRNINLEVRQPAMVRLSDTSIAFSGKAANPEYQTVLQSLLTTLETEIVAHDKTLIKKEKPNDAEWTLYLNVTGYSVPPATPTTQRTGNTTTTTNHWTGSLNVAYQVLDKTGRVHDADNVSESFDKTAVAGASKGSSVFGAIPLIGGKKDEDPVPQSGEDLKQILLHRTVDRIGSKLGNSTIMLSVRVATGDNHLNRAADFMEQRLWSRALDELQATSAYAKTDDESYRLYDLGLVYEGMSYESKTYTEQRANFFQAQEHYDKAVETNRSEKYFVETIARLRDSIARYKSLDQQQAQDRKAAPGGGNRPITAASLQTPATPAAATTTAKTASPKAHRADEIIKLFTAGVSNDQIIEIIRSAPLEFDPTDIPTVLAMKQANFPLQLQNEMRLKVGAKPLPAAAPAAPKPAAAGPSPSAAASKK
jgi:hypothetical protein